MESLYCDRILQPALQMKANWFHNLSQSLKDYKQWLKNKVKAQEIQNYLEQANTYPKIRISMTNDKSASTNVQGSESSHLQDDMTQEAFT